jgi:hypothetical protein
MAELVATRVPDLTPVAPGGEGAEGDPRRVFTWQAVTAFTHPYRVLRSSFPSGGGAPRLIADLHQEGRERCLGVWDTGTGALLHILQQEFASLDTYRWPSHGRARVVAGRHRKWRRLPTPAHDIERRRGDAHLPLHCVRGAHERVDRLASA